MSAICRYSGRRPGSVESSGERTDGGRLFHVLTFHPTGGRPLEMWIDEATFRAGRIVEKTAGDTRTTFLSLYRKVDGKWFFEKTRYDFLWPVRRYQGFRTPI